ncbi:MAG: conjugal transfer protein TrbF, partial [Hyphomonas sp.]
CLVLCFAMSGALIWRSLQSTVTPYIVEVDETGTVRAIGPATQAYDPTEAQIAHHLARFIADIRSLSADPVVVRENWLRAYDYVTPQGAAALSAHATADDPFADIGRRTRAVEVVSVVPVSGTSFQARWIEKSYEHGALREAKRFTGMFTIRVQPPRSAARLRTNPLGLYVHAFSWTEDLVTGDRP